MFSDANYAVNTEDYSPALDGYIDAAGAVPPVALHEGSPFDNTQPVIVPVVVAPPDPSYGGQAGTSKPLGWSTGIRSSRAFRQPFDGRTLRVPSMGVHPAEGPVGYSTRSDRLVYAARALQSDGMPDNATVAAEFADPNTAAIAAVTGGNPNYE